MEEFDWALGVLEVVCVPASLGWLLAAWIRPGQARFRRASAAALVVGLTLAQPIGAVATKSGPPPAGAKEVNPVGVHVLRLAGAIPILPTVVYRRENMWGTDTSAHHSLRARSWFWGPILTNSTTVTRMCAADSFIPCWNTESTNSSGYNPLAHTLHMAEKDGHLWVTIDNPAVHSVPKPFPNRIPASFNWQLSAGISLIAGVVYWVLAAILMLGARRRLRAGEMGSAPKSPKP